LFLCPVNLTVSGEKSLPSVGVEVLDTRYSAKKVGAEVRMVAPVLGLWTVTDSVVENGLELVVLASVDIGTVVHHQTGKALTL
jgi:hypothetical protein